MGNNTMTTEMKAWLDALAADLTKRMDKVQEHLASIDARLSTMEYKGSKEDANATATAKAKRDHETAIKELKVQIERAMELAGRAFLKKKTALTRQAPQRS